MSVPTDTPSTNGAPDPEEVIAGQHIERIRVRRSIQFLNSMGAEGEDATGDDWQPDHAAREQARIWAAGDLTALAAAGLRVVSEDRTAQRQDRLHDRPSDGKECGYTALATPGDGLICTKCGWVAAGVPALDDDTRRERLSAAVADGQEMVKAIRVVEQRGPLRFAKVPTVEYVELVEAAAAYLGRADDGR